ncbi:MAG TPA: MoaD/ThiS family protein [Candidatus Acidoferrales bacterium]|nr:MoaD/ThiS family protein [Candidatus Acidoferrales bacterium]
MQVTAKVRVRLFHELRATLGQSEMELDVGTLGDVVAALISRDESIRSLFFDAAGKLRGYTMFYINNTAQNPPELSRKLNDGDLILLVPTAAGG